MSYLPSHDAQHYIIAPKGSKLEWFNELVGHWSLIPLTLPLRTARITHMEHHKHANDPLLDPDYSTHAKSPLHALWKTVVNRQPRATGGFNRYGEILQQRNSPTAKAALSDALISKTLFFGILAALALSGYAIEAALLWWLPRHVALTYIHSTSAGRRIIQPTEKGVIRIPEHSKAGWGISGHPGCNITSSIIYIRRSR